MPFVLDASVALAWGLRDEATPYSEAVLTRLETDRARAPPVWPLEVANVVLVSERRRRLTSAESAAFIGELSCLPIDIDGARAAVHWGAVLTIARAHGLSAYDARYLELALCLGLPRATQDDRLRTVAAQLGVPIFVPDPPEPSTERRSPNGA